MNTSNWINKRQKKISYVFYKIKMNFQRLNVWIN